MLIGISGKARSGKDSIAEKLAELHGETRRFAFADDLKLSVRRTCERAGIAPPQGKDSRNRRLYQAIGRAYREWYGSFWAEKVIDAALFFDKDQTDSALALITDLRYPNEANLIRAAGGVILRAWVPESEREKRVLALDGPDGLAALDDDSETALDNYPHFDTVISTDGYAVMEAELRRFLVGIGHDPLELAERRRAEAEKHNSVWRDVPVGSISITDEDSP
jgi:hypothetical protein